MKQNIYPVQIIRRRKTSSVKPSSGTVTYKTLKDYLSTRMEDITVFTRGYGTSGYGSPIILNGIGADLYYQVFDFVFNNSNVRKLVRVVMRRTFLIAASKHYYDDNKMVFSIMDASNNSAEYLKYVGDKLIGNIPKVNTIPWEYVIEGNDAYVRNFEYTGDTNPPYPDEVQTYTLRFNPQYYNISKFSTPPGESMLNNMCEAEVNGSKIFTLDVTSGFGAGFRPVDYTITESDAFDEKLRTDFASLQYSLPDKLVIEFLI